MKCERHDLAIAKLAGGDLSGWRAARLQRHLDACPRCKALYADLESQRAAARNAHLDSDTAGQGILVDAIFSRISNKRSMFLPRAAAGAVAAAIVIGAVVWQLPSSRDRSNSEQSAATPVATANQETPAPYAAIELAQTQRSKVVIKMVGKNPDVVIYWLGGSTGDL